MANEKVDEKSVIREPTGTTGVQIRTNTRLRQKYFVDEKSIVGSIQKHQFQGVQSYCKVIRSSGGKPAKAGKPVTIRCSTATHTGEIQVEVLRDGPRITGIKILCPCGRHAELNCEYTA